MSDLGFNKIAFCVLGTALAMIGINEASHGLFHREEHEKPGYLVEVAETGGATGPVVEGPRDYGTLLAAADLVKGEEQHKKCVQCHTFEQGGGNLQGPNLFGVLGRDIASHAGFKYSEGDGSLSAIEGVWDYEKLDHFIERPKGYASKTAMNFAGINSRLTGLTDRINLIAYLRTLGSESVPLPAPLPPAAPAEGAVVPAADGTVPAVPADGAAPAAPAAPGAAPAPAPAAPAPAAPH